MKPTPRKPSTKDVAELAGVSLGSVSRVINKFKGVTPSVRDKVERAMAALDYRPNHAAQTLRSRSSRTVGCMLTDVTNPLYAHLFRVFEDTFREAGYMVLLANSLNNAQWELDILETFRSRGLDGVIIAPGNERHPAVRAAVESLGIPAVILDRDMAGTSHDSVLFDHASALKEAVLSLIDLGHRDIALLVADTANRPMTRRIQGYNAAFRARGLKAPAGLVLRLPSAVSPAFDAVSDLLRSARTPTALVSLGTNVLGDALNAIAACGLKIPRDISVVTMGSPEFARSHVPALASVTIDHTLAARESAQLLLRRMRGQETGGAKRVTLPLMFSPNGSCGPVQAVATQRRGKRQSARA